MQLSIYCTAKLKEERCFRCPYTENDIEPRAVFGDRHQLRVVKDKSYLGKACIDFVPTDEIVERFRVTPKR